MKYEKPDGIIEFGCSGCCCPPGIRRSGQHTNSGTSWWRINYGVRNGMEFVGNWHRVDSQSRLMSLAAAAETAEAFVQEASR